ncbi:hypothetical protein KP79_PYT17848 [Mizuhopecten yessoensis]|uniref:Uncharacterized protein n=1 Tax=Mizuhopecten yessoensis TaxID=6573 RepID=A0A210Q734_MIZYE|nr:hypothetical protein KP79_PYT17848 [Mizuhopecten yessoensis]
MELERRIPDSRIMMARSIGHPRGHKIRFTSNGQIPYRYDRSRSNLSTSLPFSRETSFEIERPQSHGASKIVINIATSFMKRDQKGRGDRSSWRYLPSLPNVTSPRSTSRDSHLRMSNNTTKYHKIMGAPGKPIPNVFRKVNYDNPVPCVSPVHLSDEKHSRIANWVRDTNTALLPDYDELEPTYESLPAIIEQ